MTFHTMVSGNLATLVSPILTQITARSNVYEKSFGLKLDTLKNRIMKSIVLSIFKKYTIAWLKN